MDMKHLSTFIALSKTLSYRKAANQLKYAPSTLFQHIQILEQELNVTLFCKTGQQLELTAEGRRFVEHATRILKDYQGALDSFLQDEEADKSISIGGCEMNTAYSLMQLLSNFSQAHLDARLSMHTSPNAGVIELVRNGTADLGYYYCLNKHEIVGLQADYLYQEPIYLIAARENPISQRRGLTYKDLSGVDIVHPHDNCCFITELLPRLTSRGVKIGNVSYRGGVQLVVDQAHEKNSLMLVPHNAMQRFAGSCGMVRLDLNEEPIWFWEALLYKRFDALKPIAKSLVRFSVSYASKVQNPVS